MEFNNWTNFTFGRLFKKNCSGITTQSRHIMAKIFKERVKIRVYKYNV